MANPGARPEIADREARIGDYDVIFLGFPIWDFRAPGIINTFLESYNFSSKVIIPFATSHGSGLGKTVEKLRPSVSRNVILKEGKLLNGIQTKDSLRKWVDSLNLE